MLPHTFCLRDRMSIPDFTMVNNSLLDIYLRKNKSGQQVLVDHTFKSGSDKP